MRCVPPGLVSITLNTDYFAPKDPSDPQHVAAAERAQEFSLGWFANPIFVNGDYPQVTWRQTLREELPMETQFVCLNLPSDAKWLWVVWLKPFW